jgi:C-terminal processing protease CtpA/Prc
MRVISIVPGSSAHKSGVILTGDRLMALDEESVFGWSLQVLRQRLHGTPGSIVTLDLENPDGPEGRKRYRINLTR